MRPPGPYFFIHTRAGIAFDAAGYLELTLAQVEEQQAFHMRKMGAAALSGDLDQHDLHQAAERVFRRAMEDHSRHHMGRVI